MAQAADCNSAYIGSILIISSNSKYSFGDYMNYTKIYNNIINNRKDNVPVGYTENHHIIPRCLGGTDDRSNLVRLTAKEHFICHLLLTKMYAKGSNEYYKMVHAFLMMLVISTTNKRRYITSKKYEQLKCNRSVIMSTLTSGKNNYSYGTMWIHNITLKECKRVLKGTILDEGWCHGRVVDWNTTKLINTNIKCKKCGEHNCMTTECTQSKRIFTFIKYFNFDKSVLGTCDFVPEYNRIVKLLNDEYNVNMLSIDEIRNKYSLTSIEMTRRMLKSLGIERRTISNALKSHFSKRGV